MPKKYYMLMPPYHHDINIHFTIHLFFIIILRLWHVNC